MKARDLLAKLLRNSTVEELGIKDEQVEDETGAAVADRTVVSWNETSYDSSCCTSESESDEESSDTSDGTPGRSPVSSRNLESRMDKVFKPPRTKYSKRQPIKEKLPQSRRTRSSSPGVKRKRSPSMRRQNESRKRSPSRSCSTVSYEWSTEQLTIVWNLGRVVLARPALIEGPGEIVPSATGLRRPDSNELPAHVNFCKVTIEHLMVSDKVDLKKYTEKVCSSHCDVHVVALSQAASEVSDIASYMNANVDITRLYCCSQPGGSDPSGR